MRIRATVAAVTGALALSAFAVPAAQAADAGSAYRSDAARTVSHSASGKTAFTATTADDDLGVTFSNFKIAAAIKVGTTNHVSTTVTYTMTHGADYVLGSDDFANGPFLYKGSSSDTADNMLFGDAPADCTATSATTASCKGLIDVYPGDDELLNSDAGTWSAGALALQYSTGDGSVQDGLGKTNVQRYSKLTVNAAPEPVKKGKTVTVTGKLSRANWEDHAYHGYTGQSVKLQYRAKSSSTYTTLKTVKTDSTGNLKTTTTATADGYYRFSFAGTTTTPSVSAAGDYVDVQ
ncbi:hypothetical protein QQY24_17805 [Streptomyces sp. TG1A-8]|uniref:hypothetical protein n=1 Tax=Streptomyces sp. TG1A-8 TaxID=3051385 RepID=UPI00265C10AA|nr:hypothetical protein [Streptomyces sp. TG1A-8]MDO0927178.1 hypothetical protein [Streptomyces sp. TG1A-8]